MDPTVAAACDFAVSSAFFGNGDGGAVPSSLYSSSSSSAATTTTTTTQTTRRALYRPIGSEADTAFSGSVVIELEVLGDLSTSPLISSSPSMKPRQQEHEKGNRFVVLKHSAVRTLAIENTYITAGGEDDPSSAAATRASKNSSKYEAALKVDRSSRNECAFLQKYSALLLQNDNTNNNNETKLIKIPRTLFARNHPAEGVTLLMESLSTWGTRRVDEIPFGSKTDATLEWLADFHAAFLPRGTNSNTLWLDGSDDNDSDGMWSVGTHLSLEKRPPHELEDLPHVISDFVTRFEKDPCGGDGDGDGHSEYFSTDAAKRQGKRLRAVASRVAKTLHPDNNPTKRTMIHGDFKHGNILFKKRGHRRPHRDDDDVHDADDDDEIAVFDWQWTGPGMGATDLIYLCAMAVSHEALDDVETNILRPYHKHLLRAIHNSNDADNDDNNERIYPYDELVDEFRIAALDYQRWMGGSRLKSMTPDTVQKAGTNIDANHGIYRRSVERLVWIFKTVDDALNDVESGRLVLLQ